MKKFLSILNVILFISCSGSADLRNERKSWNFQTWENEFKERAFCLCVLKGYEDKSIEKLLFEKDISFYSPLSMAIFDKSLEQTIQNEIQKIKLDSINRGNSYPEDLKSLYQKRNVLKHCLEFYNSDDLKELTKNEKKKWKIIRNISDEIHKSVPTF